MTTRSLHPTLAWITDPHFDHATLDAWQRWSEAVLACDPSALLVTGDLSEGEDVAFQLRRMAESFRRPIFFVLGNHDFYGGRIDQVRRQMVDLTRHVERLVYLTDAAPIELSATTVLVGDDGWGDATTGDYAHSIVRLNDFVAIDDFRDAEPERWPAMLAGQGRQSADRLAAKLAALPQHIEHVLVATHVPPFRESCWYEGHMTDDHWAPFFVCGQVGRALQAAASAAPARRFTVLCGHTHHDGVAEIDENLVVHTGHAEYGELSIESLVRCTAEGIEVPRHASR